MTAMENNGKWRLTDIGKGLLKVLKTIVKGEFLREMRIDKYFIHIIYTFFLIWVSIWMSLRMEKTYIKMEENRKTLENVKIYRAQKTIELAKLGRMSKVKRMLEEKGSKLTLAEEPANRIEK